MNSWEQSFKNYINERLGRDAEAEIEDRVNQILKPLYLTVSDHAFDRIDQRKYTPDVLVDTFQLLKDKEGKYDGLRNALRNGKEVVVRHPAIGLNIPIAPEYGAKGKKAVIKTAADKGNAFKIKPGDVPIKLEQEDSDDIVYIDL